MGFLTGDQPKVNPKIPDLEPFLDRLQSKCTKSISPVQNLTSELV